MNLMRSATFWFKRNQALLALLLVSGLLNAPAIRAQSGEGEDRLIDLTRIEQLQSAFQSDTGTVRFVTLLSPT